MIEFKNNLKKQIHMLLDSEYPLRSAKLEINYTPQMKLGDLALPFPFQLAKIMHRSPRDIAAEIAPKLTALEGIHKVDIAGNGFINLYINRDKFFQQKLQTTTKSFLTSEENKIIVEHTSINPNKAAHIGHLRNSCLGDTLARCLKYKGENVEIQNYIDDTGVQVADVVFGFMEIEPKTLEEVKNIPGKFDFYCWDLYTRVADYIEHHPGSKEKKSTILKNIEEGTGMEAKLAQHISQRILKAHLKTMQRMDISYDLQACESSIIRLKFWKLAFQLLKEKKATYFAEEGANKGCWVMKLEDENQQEKILVRSNGIVTYVGKDIAYQLWKFGLLKKDFFYESFAKQGKKTIWITSSKKNANSPEFGQGSRVYNVIDIRQAYPQKIVVQSLRSLKFAKQAEKSTHFSYEMVALSPKSLEELDVNVSKEDRDKDFLEVSGRKGLGVKADDLLDKLEEKALVEVEKRNPNLSAENKRRIAQKIASGSVRYFMLKFARNSIIIFDFEDALSFEGETGPYLQYTFVRINSIFRKLEENFGFDQTDLQSLIKSSDIHLEVLPESEYSDFWEIILFASKLDEEILHSLNSLEFLHLAKFAFELCQKFNAYYHKYSILSEKNRDIKNIRILTIHFVLKTLKTALELIGIPQPERM
jgi:arginyl-tRNA synthetase